MLMQIRNFRFALTCESTLMKKDAFDTELNSMENSDKVGHFKRLLEEAYAHALAKQEYGKYAADLCLEKFSSMCSIF